MSNDQPSRRHSPVRKLASRILWGVESLIARASLVGNPPIFDPKDFPWAQTLEEHTPVIRQELEQIMQQPELLPNFQEISSDQIAITRDDGWKTYFLYGMGYKAERNCARCPETSRLIEQVPGMKTAFFSILSPGKHIPPHRGLYKGFLRYHLALIVPEPKDACWIRVDNQIAHWEEGKSLMFDDTYEHEVRNDTDSTRVVLFMDVVRPLRFPFNLMNELIIQLVKRSGYVQQAKKNQEAWEARQRELAAPPQPR